MSKQLLIIFVKNPELGKAKTRLAATIGDQKALEVYKLLLEKTHQVTQALTCDKVVFYSDYIDPNDLWNSGIYSKRVQEGNDLGERMSNAFRWAFDNLYSSVCIIGSDCYDLTSEVLNNGFDALSKNDLVIGPYIDGGYYLLGSNKHQQEIFEDIPWSSGIVFDLTLEKAKILNLKVSHLTPLRDIDDEEDLHGMTDFLHIL